MSRGVLEEDDTTIALATCALPGTRRARLLALLGNGGTLKSLAHHLQPSDRKRGGEIQRLCGELDIEVVAFSDLEYPESLKMLPHPPAALFIRAEKGKRAFPAHLVGVVGTRAASVEMCHHTALLASHLAREGVCIVSGLALGIDGAAHRGALLSGNRCSTIAVVAHGLELTYPPSHEPLAQSIVRDGGMIVSEYPPGVQPLKRHFLERNRIIAGLVRGVVVVEAGERSGSLVTARYAADFGRDVFVFTDPGSEKRQGGGERLLEEGAIPISSAEEILREYSLSRGATAGCQTTLTAKWETISLEAFLERTKYSSADLLRLEMEGRVVRLPGNRVSVALI